MELETISLYCMHCREMRDHRRTVRFNDEGWQVVMDTCPDCATTQTRGALVHYAWRADASACLLPLGRGVYAGSDLLERVECPECLHELVHTHAEVPAPDWRPAAALAEDYYAV